MPSNIAKGISSTEASTPSLFWTGTFIGGQFNEDGGGGYFVAVVKRGERFYDCMSFFNPDNLIAGNQVMVVNTSPPAVIGKRY